MAVAVAIFGAIASGAYLIAQINRTTEQTRLLVNQSRMMRTAMDDIIETERAVRAMVARKEWLIRGMLKRQYGWTDADIEAVMESEARHEPRRSGPGATVLSRP